MNYLKYLILFIFSLVTLGSYADIPRINRRHEKDHREIKTPLSPEYLNAIGSLGYVDEHEKLRSKRYKNIECGANLISTEKGVDSDVIITAEHCIFDTINTYTWTSYNNENEKIFRKGKLFYKNKKADIAFIELTQKVKYKDIKPLIIQDNIDIQSDNFLVGGYSMDYLGNYGKELTYDSPKYVKLGNKNGFGEVGSLTYQGDSGGAVIYNDEESDTQYIVGVMSYIQNNANAFKNEVNKFGNISGHFVDLINYKPFFNFIKEALF